MMYRRRAGTKHSQRYPPAATRNGTLGAVGAAVLSKVDRPFGGRESSRREAGQKTVFLLREKALVLPASTAGPKRARNGPIWDTCRTAGKAFPGGSTKAAGTGSARGQLAF